MQENDKFLVTRTLNTFLLSKLHEMHVAIANGICARVRVDDLPAETPSGRVSFSWRDTENCGVFS